MNKKNMERALLSTGIVIAISAVLLIVVLLGLENKDNNIEIKNDEITYIETETANIKIITGTTSNGTPYTDVITEAKAGQEVTTESYDETFTYDVIMVPFKNAKEEK